MPWVGHGGITISPHYNQDFAPKKTKPKKAGTPNRKASGHEH